MNTFKVKRSDKIVKALIEAAFPDYNGRKVEITFTDSVKLYGCAWDEGSKNSWAAVKTDLSVSHLPWTEQWDNPYNGKEVNLTPEMVVLKHCIYIGKDMGITIYAHTSLMPKMIGEA